MSYISDIVCTLVRVLEHTRGLPRHQLAAHAANVEFWADEARHALEVIDGYNARFSRMRKAQSEYDREHGGHPANDPAGWPNSPTSEKPIRPSVGDAERKSLRADVLTAIDQLLDRLSREGFLQPDSRSALELRIKRGI